MYTCPVCPRKFSTSFALNGHIRLSTDQKHISYLGKPPLIRRYKESQQKNLQCRLEQESKENRTLKQLLAQEKRGRSNYPDRTIPNETERSNEQVFDQIEGIRTDVKKLSEKIEEMTLKGMPRQQIKPNVPLAPSSDFTLMPKTSTDQTVESTQQTEDKIADIDAGNKYDWLLYLIKGGIESIPEWKKIRNSIDIYLKTGVYPYSAYTAYEKKRNDKKP